MTFCIHMVVNHSDEIPAQGVVQGEYTDDFLAGSEGATVLLLAHTGHPSADVKLRVTFEQLGNWGSGTSRLDASIVQQPVSSVVLDKGRYRAIVELKNESNAPVGPANFSGAIVLLVQPAIATTQPNP